MLVFNIFKLLFAQFARKYPFLRIKFQEGICLLAVYLITARVLTLTLWLGFGLREGLNCDAAQ